MSYAGSLSSITSSGTSTKFEAADQNKNEQKRIDNDIILSGFPNKPNSVFVEKSLMKILNIVQNEVKSIREFQVQRHHLVQYFVVISFKEKTSQIKVLNAISNLKTPLKYSDFLKDSIQSANSDTIINCQMCLTKFNNSVLQELKKFKSWRIIAEFKFEDFRYHVKQNKKSTWRPVRHYDDLKRYQEQAHIKSCFTETSEIDIRKELAFIEREKRREENRQELLKKNTV